ncbi:hypothetical protein IQ272_29810 [Chroococcidiopsidales cyanobacterium LEGE 13417]|nr:hypothetical protein [Chroococcidiopsidales cyanobacterium LEGE 13417]
MLSVGLVVSRTTGCTDWDNPARSPKTIPIRQIVLMSADEWNFNIVAPELLPDRES